MKKLSILMIVLLVVSLAGAGWTQFRLWSSKDETLPVIECPETPLVLQVGENDPDTLLEGVSAWDDKDGDLTSRVMVEGIARSVENNETTITYAVVDSDCHVAKQTRTVQYSDYQPPRFGLSQELRYEVGQPVVVRDRVTATDVIDGDLSNQVKVTSTGLNANVEGRYPVTFEVTNSMGDTSVWTAEIRIANYQTGEPRILLSQYLVYLKQGEAFQSQNYLSQVIGGELEDVTVESGVDTSTPGTYQVTYSCIGNSGTAGTAVLFVVVV